MFNFIMELENVIYALRKSQQRNNMYNLDGEELKKLLKLIEHRQCHLLEYTDTEPFYKDQRKTYYLAFIWGSADVRVFEEGITSQVGLYSLDEMPTQKMVDAMIKRLPVFLNSYKKLFEEKPLDNDSAYEKTLHDIIKVAEAINEVVTAK